MLQLAATYIEKIEQQTFLPHQPRQVIDVQTLNWLIIAMHRQRLLHDRHQWELRIADWSAIDKCTLLNAERSQLILNASAFHTHCSLQWAGKTPTDLTVFSANYLFRKYSTSNKNLASLPSCTVREKFLFQDTSSGTTTKFVTSKSVVKIIAGYGIILFRVSSVTYLPAPE